MKVNFKSVNIDNQFNIGEKLTLIAGPCAIENEKLCFEVGTKLKELCEKYGLNYIFKASFDKANRTSSKSLRGMGMEDGIRILKKIKKDLNVPVLTDVHESYQCELVKDTVDVIQIPAFLSRQTDLLVAAGRTGCAVNVKKGQFMAPCDVFNSAKKVISTGNHNVMICERGVSFGYNNLVVDYTGILEMLGSDYEVVFDATHSVQKPASLGTATGGNREYVMPLIKAAISIGVKTIFAEVHTNPNEAISDAANQLFLGDMEENIKIMSELYDHVNKGDYND